MNNRKFLLRQKYLVEFYNLFACKKVSQLSEIPADKLSHIYSLSYVDTIKPFVKEDIAGGKSRNRLRKKYLVPASTIRAIGKELGLYCQA